MQDQEYEAIGVVRRHGLPCAVLLTMLLGGAACRSPSPGEQDRQAAQRGEQPASGRSNEVPSQSADGRPSGVDETTDSVPAVAVPPAAVPPAWPTLAVGRHHTCALVVRGEQARRQVVCWGGNEFGQLGTGDTRVRGKTAAQMGDALVPVVLPQDADLVAVDARGDRSCALSRDGRLWCWGADRWGELGRDDALLKTEPSFVTAPAGPIALPGAVQSFSLGPMHTCVVFDDGSLRCWGAGSDGQLGLGDTQSLGDDPGELGSALMAVDLGTGRSAVAVAAGDGHTCTLLDDGTVKCFGLGRYGVLGLADTRSRGIHAGEMGDSLQPVGLGLLQPVQLTTGGLHACVRSAEPSVTCWGHNRQGQLGHGHTQGPGDKPGQSSVVSALVKLDLGRDLVSIAGGDTATCALFERARDSEGALDNAIKCWGGAYGDGSPDETGSVLASLDFGADRVPLAIAPGDLHSCAIVVERGATIGNRDPKTGRVVCWGVDVPGVGISHGTGVPVRRRRERVSESLPRVDLGRDVRVVVPRWHRDR